MKPPGKSRQGCMVKRGEVIHSPTGSRGHLTRGKPFLMPVHKPTCKYCGGEMLTLAKNRKTCDKAECIRKHRNENRTNGRKKRKRIAAAHKLRDAKI